MTHNTGINPSFPETPFSQRFRDQIERLHGLSGGQALADFDTKTEQLIRDAYGETNDRLEAYRYATMAEAENIVNLPESAQEESAQDLPKKAIQQRRQVLEAIISELQETEAREEGALIGDDHEDPPMMS
jgi:hypothetical protein